jgi:MarR family 2-MHQ and catechol resistance regulon transcriptional repressor
MRAMLACALRPNYLSTEMKRSPTLDPPARGARRAPVRRAATAEATALKLFVVLARAQTAVTRHADADIARHGLTLQEFAILEVLYHKGPLLLGDVQRKILVSSGGVTYLVDRLETKGLVERQECPEDRRARYAALTLAGEKLLGRIFPPHARSIARAVSGLTKAEQRRLTALLKRLGTAAAALPLAKEPQ